MITPVELITRLSTVTSGKECAEVFFEEYPNYFPDPTTGKGQIIFAALECAFEAGRHYCLNKMKGAEKS